MFHSISRYIKRPQEVFLRKVMFQIHLWVGLAATLYVALIGLSGAILVFRPELYRLNHPRPVVQVDKNAITIGPGDAVRSAIAARPGTHATWLYYPREDEPYYSVIVSSGRDSRSVDVHPTQGTVLQINDTNSGWLSVVGNFHYVLLLPRNVGLMWNGIGATALLVLAASGLVLWWPGIRSWKRAFVFDLNLSFKRVIRDSHNVVGWWILGLISFWAFSGIFFAWPKQTSAFINLFSKVSNPRGRTPLPVTPGKPLDLNVLHSSAQAALPGEVPYGIRIPGEKGPHTFYLVHKLGMTYTQSDSVTLDSATGKIMRTMRRDAPKTMGDRILSLIQPLHFGTQWGLGVKIVYFLAGLAIPFLSVTGVMMYWHRFLGKRWKKLSERRVEQAPANSVEPVSS